MVAMDVSYFGFRKKGGKKFRGQSIPSQWLHHLSKYDNSRLDNFRQKLLGGLWSSYYGYHLHIDHDLDHTVLYSLHFTILWRLYHSLNLPGIRHHRTWESGDRQDDSLSARQETNGRSKSSEYRRYVRQPLSTQSIVSIYIQIVICDFSKNFFSSYCCYEIHIFEISNKLICLG